MDDAIGPETPAKPLGTRLLTLILFLLSVGLAMLSLATLESVLVVGVARIVTDANRVEFFRLALLPVLAIVGIIFVTATGEVHRRHAGEHKSARLFAITYAVLAFFVVLRLAVMQ